MTVAFVFVLAPFLLLSSHILLTLFRQHHMAPGETPGWPPFVIFTAVAVLIFGILAWHMVGKTLSPIRALARQAEESSVEHTGTRLTPPSDDEEMRELVSTLNAFLDRIELAAEEKARFYGAASHELRTPLQALSGHLEVALSQPRSAEEYAASLAEAQEQARRLIGLVESILLLHQLEGRADEKATAFDARDVMMRTTKSMASLAEARHIEVVEDLLDTTLSAAPGHFEILTRNLVENALKYSPEGSVVRIRLGESGMEIENRIVGDLDPEQFMQPFYRREASRSTASGGNGLGLAICRAICRANGWTIALARGGSDCLVAQVKFTSA